MRLSFKALFKEQPEHSVALRLQALFAVWVTGLSLAIVGASPLVGLGAPALAAIGHYWSWKTRSRKMGLWRVGLMCGVIVLMAIMGLQMPAALQGNWMPPTIALVLVQAVASFDIRTRSNISTSFLVSSIILILASQLAFTSLFVVPLGLYLLLLLAYLATSAAIDAKTGAVASLAWVGRSRAVAWAGWTAAIAALGVALFLVLPWGTVQVNATVAASAMLPVTGAQERPEGEEERPQPEPSAADLQNTAGGAGEAGGASSQSAQPADASAGNQAPPRETPGRPGSSDEVLRVRSPVASYWRTRTHVTQDGRNWQVQSAPVEQPSRGRVSGYTQTVYVAQGQAAPSLGYAPIEWETLTEKEGLDSLNKGSVYLVRSERRSYDPEVLRFLSAQAFIRTQRANRLPSSIAALAQEVTGDKGNLYDRSQAITDYLNKNFKLDKDAPKDRLSKSSEEFLFEGKRTGGSFDFAAAEALLALGAGLDARVATGYLPGQFDPLSGAYIVRQRDAHAWAEVRYPGAGWVPFDPSPQPEVQRQQAKPGFGAKVFGNLFKAQFGDDARGDISAFLSNITAGRMALVAFVLVAILGMAGLWYFLRHRRRAPAHLPYALLRDAERKAVMDAWRRLQPVLRKRGILPKAHAETLTAYFARATTTAPDLREELAALRDRIARAAYSPAAISPGEGHAARAALARIAASA
jgi:transglutaminase-like putative cysteine protease